MTLTAAPEAAALPRAAHMQGEPVPATVRLESGAGNPEHPDWAPDPRGLAVTLYLPDGSRIDMVPGTLEIPWYRIRARAGRRRAGGLPVASDRRDRVLR